MKVVRIAVLGVFILFAYSLQGQTTSGSILGEVNDASGSVVPGATVELVHDLSKQTRTFTTDSTGSFIFTGLVPGVYNLRITQPGFNAYVQNGITVSAQERVSLHTQLNVGEVSTSIEVQANAAHVATESSDRSVNITTTQIVDTPSRGRDFLALAKTLPGVIDVQSHDSRGWGANRPVVNGGQNGQFLVTLDGIASVDSGAPSSTGAYLGPSVDAIAEVKVLMANYPAEYGARAGGQMNITMKNGTNAFHGSAYYYWRHEQLNANEWFNDATGIAKPQYRFQNPGGTVGGPLLIPGTNFNKDRTKLFFFFSYDNLHNRGATTSSRFTLPSAAERAGDFSQTFTSTGALIAIKDPNTGVQFPGNIIPTSRISPQGFALLNLFALPNTTDPTGRRGYNFTNELTNSDFSSQPREDKILRIDYNLGPKTTIFGRLIQDYYANDGYGGPFAGNATGWGWGQFPGGYHLPSAGAVGTVIHTFRPNLVNEFTVGTNRSNQVQVSLDIPGQPKYESSLLPALKGPDGKPVTMPKIFDANNLNLSPNVFFNFPTGFVPQSAGQTIPGGATATPTFGFEVRWPYNALDYLKQMTNNVSWIKGSHNTKFGIYWENVYRKVPVYGTWTTEGRYYFGSDTSSAVDTGYPYSNALIGSALAYGEDNQKLINYAHYNQVEWFVQDSWKVTRRLTIDYGLRFSKLGSVTSKDADLGFFSGKAYDPAKAGQLLYPAVVGGKNAAVNPTTGAVYPYARWGTYDPASYAAGGSPYSGINHYKTRFWNDPFEVGPRVGFALDVFGNGKTAVRGGFGIFFGRPFGVDTIGATGGTLVGGTGPMTAPPNFRAPLLLNSTISDIPAAGNSLTPASVYSGSQNFPPPSTYTWSFGVQQAIGGGLILDVAYVGNVAHHQFANVVDANAPAPYTTWTPTGGVNPKYLDPTSGGKRLYSTDIIRELAGGYKGYGAIPVYTQAGETYYNALQTQLNKRVGKRLQFSVNHTWSKTLVYARNQFLPDQLTKNVASTDRPQVVNMNFGYALPDGSQLWKNAFTKQALDGWRLSGGGTFAMGTPMTVQCSATSTPIGYWYGTPSNTPPLRCQMTGDLFLPEGTAPPAGVDPRLWYPFDASHFTLPPATSFGIGTTPPTLTYGPGIESIDLSVAKTFRLKESWSLELKAETFNFLNHFNPANPDTTLQINYATGANANAGFGKIGSTQGAQVQARHMALSARFRF